MKNAFTMIELVFVVVVIGILAAVAIPKFAMTRNDAIITKAKTTVGALRSAIATERQKQILRGNYDDINISTAMSLLEYGYDSNRWSIDSTNNKITFTAPNGNTCEFDLVSNKLNVNSSNCNVDGLDDL